MGYPAKYRVSDGRMLVTKPGGEQAMRDVKLFWNSSLNTIGILLVGASPIQGYSFELALDAVNTTMQNGEWSHIVAKIT